MHSRPRRLVVIALTVIGGLMLIAQLVPYGRQHTNPPILDEPPWDRPETRALAKTACFDCHSNETRWPWYSHVAPVSWLVQHHVDDGRSQLNFSEWSRAGEEADEASETVRSGEMPPASYVMLHPSARLTADQRAQLARGLAVLSRSRGAAEHDEAAD